MKTKTKPLQSPLSLAVLALCIAGCCLIARAQTSAFTYQGQLTAGPNQATGNYDLKFTLYDALTGGNFIAGPITNASVAVSNGLFTVTLDFGPGVFTGTNYWVELAVRPSGFATFSSLVPRQQLTPAPYAISLVQPQASGLCPAGSVIAFAGTNAPVGWLICDGSTKNATNSLYATLFATIGKIYGGGDGSSFSFNLPDLRSRAVVGAGQGAGTDDHGASLSNRAINQKFGEETHVLSTNEMPAHSHAVNNLTTSSTTHSHTMAAAGGANGSNPFRPLSSQALAGSTLSTATDGGHTHTVSGNTDNAGNGQSHNVCQPSIVLNYIIKY